MTGRIVQIVCAGFMLAAAQPVPRAPGKVDLALSILGERENPDGSWEGSDLLAHPGGHSSRFQLDVRSEWDVVLAVDARLPDGTRQRIFPEPGKQGVLARGQSYSLPAPNAFYALEGEVTLEVHASPVRPSALPESSTFVRKLDSGPTLALSDGARIPVRQLKLSGSQPLRFDVALSSR